MLRIITAALGAVGLLTTCPARAEVQTTTTLTFNSNGTIVDNFATVFGSFPGGLSAPAFTIYGGPDITPGTTVFAAVSTPDYVMDAYFFLGVSDGKAGAESGVQHLVVGGNQLLAGQSFASLFPTYSEDGLLKAIVGLNEGTAASLGAEYQLVSGFEAQYGPQYAFSLNGTGFLTSFSDSRDYGTIVTSQNSVEVPSGVPEPRTWIMMMLGIGVLGIALRRRPRRSPTEPVLLQFA
jgi:hypothetical protein